MSWRRERFKMARRREIGCIASMRVLRAPRHCTEPVTTLVVMLAAVKFGLRHQLLLQTETRLGLAHKARITHLDLFLETFISEMMAADRSDVSFNDWLKRMVAEHYPGFGKSKRLDLPSGDYLRIPEGHRAD